jgi:hypothetical protein
LLELAVRDLKLGPAAGIRVIGFQVEGIVSINREDAVGVAVVADDLKFNVRVDSASQAECIAAQAPLRRPQYLAQGRFEKGREILIGR